MKTILKTTVIAIACTLGVVSLNAQSVKKHEIKPFYGTAPISDDADFFAKTLAKGLFGTGKTEETTFGMVGLGYRYNLNRFNVGIDLGYSSGKEEFYKKATDKTPYETAKIKKYFIMPTTSYSYYKNGLIDLYGSASVGAIIQKTTSDNKETKALNEKSFAYQINPIGLRIGNETIGGFIELGYGDKGLVSAGLSFKF